MLGGRNRPQPCPALSRHQPERENEKRKENWWKRCHSVCHRSADPRGRSERHAPSRASKLGHDLLRGGGKKEREGGGKGGKEERVREGSY